MPVFHRLRQFLRDDRASVSVEAVLILPILLWAYYGMFILFEGYRALSANSRAAYTIADFLSREQDYVTDEYMNGLNDLLDMLTHSNRATVLRVSVVSYDTDTEEFDLKWSNSTQPGIPKITDGSLDTLTPHLPMMASPGIAIVVETWLAYEPFMNISLDAFYFESLVVTRPRFGPQLCYTPTLPAQGGNCYPT